MTDERLRALLELSLCKAPDLASASDGSTSIDRCLLPGVCAKGGLNSQLSCIAMKCQQPRCYDEAQMRPYLGSPYCSGHYRAAVHQTMRTAIERRFEARGIATPLFDV